MASNTYNSYLKNLLDGTIDLGNDTIKLSLHTSSYTPDIDTHDFFNDVTNEVGASGTYSTGGVALTTSTSQDNINDESVFDATDVSFTSATITARYAVIRKYVGTDATDPLILYIDFGSDQTSTTGTFTITFAAEGILNIG